MLAIIEEINKRVDAIENGEVDSLEVYAQLSILEKECKAAKDKIFETTMNDAELEDGKTFKKKGFEFTIRGGGGRYSYKEDQVWVNMEGEKKKHEQLMQQAYKLTQSGGGLVYDAEGVEVIAASYTPTKGSLSIKKVD